MEGNPPTPNEDDTFLLRLLADGLRPDPRRTVAEWAGAERVVSEGAYEGKWRNERAPYLVEIMEVCSLNHPARRVSVLGSAQIGKTQVGLNLSGQILSETPAQALIVLPSLNSLRFYNRDKLDRMIQATPCLSGAVADVTERSGQGSTTSVKRGARGAQIELVTASSSRDLQGRTCRVVIMEEISEYDRDVGGRGDPADQAMARTIQWRKRGEKVVDISTPAIKGTCRITKLFETGSGGRFQVPCPTCEHLQELRFTQLTWKTGEPETAAYACESCGVLIGENYKAGMLAAGRWVHERPDLRGRHASYRIDIMSSPFTPWSEVAKESEKVDADPGVRKAFCQQWLGEAWDEAFDLPKAEVLLQRRSAWPVGRIPPGVLMLMAATDVHGDRLEWAVWGFDRHFGQWLIDTGVLAGDPTRPEVWLEHDLLLRRHWVDAWGRKVVPFSWAIDSAYLTTHAYSYARRHSADKAPEVIAIRGKEGWGLPAVGPSKVQDIDWNGQKIGSVGLRLVGTWDMKSELSGALRLTEQGPGPDGWPPGALRFNQQIDRDWLDQLLSEHFVVHPKTGERAWKKLTSRNEAWDLAVYTRALARLHTERFTEAQWDGLTANLTGEPEAMQPDLAILWAPRLIDLAKPAAPVPPIAVQQQEVANAGRSVTGVGRSLR